MLNITRHAFLRAKERLGLSHEAFRRTSAMAYCFGMPGERTKGRLHNFIAYKGQLHPDNIIRLYGENMFVFKGNTLITVYQLPRDLKDYYLKLKNRNE